MRLHFHVHGQAGPPLLLLHGLFGSLVNWGAVSHALRDEFRVWALDLRNHGRSPHADEMDYALMAEDVAEFMRSEVFRDVPPQPAAGGQPAIQPTASRRYGSALVIGHSMGGKVAMELALRYPSVVAALVIEDIAPRAYPPWHMEILEALLGLDVRAFERRHDFEVALEPAIPDLALRRFLLKNLAPSPQGGFHWSLNLPAIARNYPKLSEALASGRRFEGPALFVRGGESDYVRPADETEIRRLFPRSEFATVAGARHWVHSDAPAAFIRTVREFLCRVRNAR
jgi:esterase